MSKHPRITDHAVIRYLERVKGIDMDALRHEIGQLVARGYVQGACGVRVSGFNYRIENGVVVTVLQESRHDHRHGRRTRAKHERDDL
ncbi:MAG: hypothetical protein JXR35_03925 [Rhodobacteraceae bacterium]|nr:hypothetical protein [Paracoccaceae bacterium]